MRTHVDLFSGIGGFSLACKWAGVETIAFAETDDYASRVLKRHWPNVRNYGDVRGFPSLSAWLLTAGVPCQPASVAGKRKGAADDRWLWPETLAVVEKSQPAWICIENPTGILSMEQPVMSFDLAGYGNLIEEAIRSEGDFWAALTGEVELIFRDIVASIEKLGYEVAPVVIPACGLGAWHRRYRVWILGHSTRLQSQQGEQSTGPHVAGLSGPQSISDAHGGRRKSRGARSQVGSVSVVDGERERNADGRTDQWVTEPNVGRVVDGLPSRLDRLRGLGNAIVPQVAHQIIKRMIEAENSFL